MIRCPSGYRFRPVRLNHEPKEFAIIMQEHLNRVSHFRQESGRPSIFSTRGIKLALILIAGLTSIGAYCAGSGGSASSVAGKETAPVVIESDVFDAILRQIKRADSSGLDLEKAIKGAFNFLLPFPGGKGRSCSTCHDSRDGFSLLPATVEARWQRLQRARRVNPNDDDPLFRSIDAD